MKLIHSVSPRRLIMVFLGNIFLAMGISIFKLSGLGNDPFSGMVMALSDVCGIAYANFLVLVNLALFVIQLCIGRKLIGIGTVVNSVLVGYVVTFFYNLWITLFGVQTQSALIIRILIMFIGVIATSFGVSMYQNSKMGVAPYDALSLIMTERWPKIRYFWHRISNDAVCALVCFFAGGIVGLGTLTCAFFLGPFVHFFDRWTKVPEA